MRIIYNFLWLKAYSIFNLFARRFRGLTLIVTRTIAFICVYLRDQREIFYTVTNSKALLPVI